MATLMNTYGERTTTLVKGEGVYLWDSHGKRYLDALCGIAVCGLGYRHPAVTRAICEQADALLHCSNLHNNEIQQALGTTLCEIANMDKAFFCNSGAEANEAALKIARKFGHDQGFTAPQVITTTNSFHGRTMATLSATGNKKIHAGFEPLLDGFAHVPYNNPDAIAQAATGETVAILVEPIQGEGGINVPKDNYLPSLRALCDSKGWLLILDEIQSGNGRTGKYFAFQHHDILPDVLTTAKGLGNGVPIGACLARGKAAEVLQPGNHGSTFGGNLLTCAAALATVKTIVEENLSARAQALGTRIYAALEKQLRNNSKVVDIRAKGLMLGIELHKDCGHLVEKAKEKGLLLNVTAGSTIRLLPPLILSDDQAQTVADTVVELVNNFE